MPITAPFEGRSWLPPDQAYYYIMDHVGMERASARCLLQALMREGRVKSRGEGRIFEWAEVITFPPEFWRWTAPMDDGSASNMNGIAVRWFEVWGEDLVREVAAISVPPQPPAATSPPVTLVPLMLLSAPGADEPPPMITVEPEPVGPTTQSVAGQKPKYTPEVYAAVEAECLKAWKDGRYAKLVEGLYRDLGKGGRGFPRRQIEAAWHDVPEHLRMVPGQHDDDGKYTK
jgi:hypothetical protein